tara:strand:- start:17679 stop:18413 length:735 start_codon:yes stop_codon:yes gene_type:complete
MNILITVCARGGSKGVPNKNIKNIKGKPLIYYSLDLIKELKKEKVFENSDVVLSSDSDKIKRIVSVYENLKINLDYERPEYLATDESGKLDVIIDVKNFMSSKNEKVYDYVLDLDVTSPLRTSEDILLAFDKLQKNKDASNIFSVNLANKNPYFNMVEENKRGFYSLCKNGEFLSRQKAPKVYEMNASFYIYRNSFFELNKKRVITENSLIFEMKHICFDIDHPIDFNFMEYLLENNKLDFIIK